MRFDLKRLFDRIVVDLYQIVLVTLLLIASTINDRIFYSVIIFLGFCIPGFIDVMINGSHSSGREKFFVPLRFKLPYKVLVFIWNGFKASQ